MATRYYEIESTEDITGEEIDVLLDSLCGRYELKIKCRTDFEGICDYCDGVRKVLKDTDYTPISIRMPLLIDGWGLDSIPLYQVGPTPSGYEIPLYIKSSSETPGLVEQVIYASC